MLRNARALNRWGTLAALPVMALAIILLSRATSDDTGEPPTAGRLVVASLRDDTLTFYDFRAGGQQSLVLPGPGHEMVGADGRLYVTVPRLDLLVEVEAGAPGVLRTLEVAGEPHGLALDGDSLFVALDAGGEVVRIDRATLTETGRWSAGDTPHAVSAADGRAIVASARDAMVRAVPDGLAVPSAGPLPESVTIAGGHVVVANADSGSVGFHRSDDLEVVGAVDVGGRPVRVLALDAATVAVAVDSRGEVAIIDADALRVAKRFDAGGRPDGLCASPDGRYLAVVSNAGDRVTIRETEGWEVVLRVDTSDGPGACLWLSGD